MDYAATFPDTNIIYAGGNGVFKSTNGGQSWSASNGGLTNLAKINQVVTVAGLTPFDPFQTVPVEGVNYKKDPAFGGAIDRFAYTSPRTFRFSVGVKF